MNLLYNLIKLYFFSFLSILIQTNDKYEENLRTYFNSEEYNSLLNWAKKNSLNITDKIKLTEFGEEKQYIVINPISKGEIILDIPPNITININTFYNYFPSQDLKIKYEKYYQIGKESKQMLNDISFIEQSFMSYLLYKINKSQETNQINKEINKFIEFYKPLFYILDTENLIHLPSSFNNKQINSFMNSSFNNFFNLMNQYLMGEVSTLQEEIFNEKDINTNDYFKYRFLLLQKTLNISHTTTLVPFIDLIKHEFNKSNINCKLIVNKGHIKIKAIKNINRNEVLTIKQRKITNQYSFYFYGKTYDELIDYMPSFIVPIVIPNILIDEGIELDINEDEEENKVDLAWDKFYDVVLPSYKELMRQIQKEDSNINCYKLFLKYIILIRDTIKKNKVDELEEIFEEEIDVDNVKRIIKGDIVFLNKKINELENVIEKYNKEKDNINEKKKEINKNL